MHLYRAGRVETLKQFCGVGCPTPDKIETTVHTFPTQMFLRREIIFSNFARHGGRGQVPKTLNMVSGRHFFEFLSARWSGASA